ncbi:MAG: DNA internalization-related competence protein ComEC/Rec2 [Gammaproteobacteria bacterium]|nr:DNA internalization-related competence protein ComEC/Rec2 [Gammaproteobacteria bacterium]
MHTHLLAMALGLLASAFLPNWLEISAASTGLFVGLVVGACVAVRFRHRRLGLAKIGLCVAAFSSACLFGFERIESLLAHRLPVALNGSAASAEIVVLSTPMQSGLALRFEAEVRSLGTEMSSPHTPKRLRVTWFKAPATPQVGDLWSMRLKLRAPIGTLNARSFDYEAWLLSQGVDALASVESGVLIARRGVGPVEHARQRLRAFVESIEIANRGPMRALAMGDASVMQRHEWRLFRDTGTVHLMVISGLHLGLVAFYAGLIGLGVARLVPTLCLLLPAQVWGVLVGMLAALLFALLCGWSLPVKRAFIMICCAGAALIWRRPFGLVNAWLVALILVLAMSPFASLASGFWLSFGAVGLLMLIGWNASRGSGILFWGKQLVRTQLFLSLGMSPLLLVTVSEMPLASPLANLIAVPVTTFIIVPLVLIANLLLAPLPALAALSLIIADNVFSAQILVLEQLAAWPNVRAATMNPLIAGACLASLLCVFLPATTPLRALLASPGIILAIVIIPSSERLPQGEFEVRLLDVGQGLALLVETQGKSLLFDTGASYSEDFDFGDAVVVPEVRFAGRRALDRLLISHWDVDHAGGAASVIESVDVSSLVAAADGAVKFPLGDPVLATTEFESCRAGQGWIWDGVRFSMMHPSVERDRWASTNDRSCVLLIENDELAVLIPADISQGVEFEIMNGVPKLTLLIAAHHGSRSSSSMSFLRRTRPDMVFVSAGFDNRFGHPHRDRVDAWRFVGAEVYGTAQFGALHWRSLEPQRVQSARESRHAFWRLIDQNAE